MSKRIERNEIAEQGVLDNLLEPLKKLITSLDEADKKLKGFASSVKDSVKSADDAKGMRELEEATNKTNKAFQQKLEIDKQREKLTKDIEKAEAKLKLMEDEKYKQLQEINAEIREKNKQSKKTVKLTEEETKTKIKQNKANREYKKALADEIILNDKNAGTLEKLAASNRILRREREKLNLDTEEGAKRLKEINLQIDANNEAIEDNSDKLKKQRLNVGNYTESIQEATGELGGLIGGIKKTVDGIKDQIDGFREASKGAEGFRQKAKLLGKTLKGIGLGLIISALGAVYNAFAGTREGVLTFEATIQKASATLGMIGQRIVDFFTKAGLKAEQFKLEIKDLFTFDDAESRKLNDRIKEIDKQLDELDKKDYSIDESFANIDETIKKTFELEDAIAVTAEQIEKLRGQEELLSERAGDMTISFDEQRKAQEQYNATVIERIKLEKELSTQNLEVQALKIRQQLIEAGQQYSIEQIKNLEFLQDEEARLKISSDALAELRDAKTELIEKDNELTASLAKNAMERRNTEKDDFEKQLDYAIDAFDVNKTINERIINLETTTLAEREVLTEKTRMLADKAYKNQIKLVEDYTKQKIDFEKLIALQDEESIRRELDKNNLNETTLTRILEIIKERKIAVQDLADLELDTASKRLEMNQAILESEQAIDQDEFSLRIEKLQKQLELEEDNFEKRKQLFEQIKQAKIAQLQDQAEYEKQVINDSIMEEEQKAQEIKEINEILSNDIERINMETLEAQKENNEEAKQDFEQLFNDVTGLAVDAYTNMADNAIDALKQQEEASAQMYDALANMAAQGNITAQQSLAEQIKAQEDAQKAQMEIEKKKQKIQLISQGLGVFGSLLDSGQKPTEALANTAVSMSALVGLINSLPSFDVGTENTGKNGKGVDGKGGFISILHPNERVMTAEQNAMTAGLSNPMLADVAYQYKTGQLVPVGQSNNSAVVNRLDSLYNLIEKQPQMITGLEQTLGGMMKLIVTEKKGHHKNTNTYKS